MSELVVNCPRCRAAEITFTLKSGNQLAFEYGWQLIFEAFCICRNCKKSTVFVLKQRTEYSSAKYDIASMVESKMGINKYFSVDGYISLKDRQASPPPEYLPASVDKAFREGAACSAIGCYNAAATMFRLCLDLATRTMTPAEDQGGPNNKIRRSLGLRLEWLFKNGILPAALEELSHCVKDDGNDGAHEGSLSETDAADLNDFAFLMLERIYTEPRRIMLARERMEQRKKHTKN